MTLPTLAGARVTLRPMSEDESTHLGRWFSDERFQRLQWAAWHGPMSAEGAREFWQRFQVPDGGLFVIEHDRRPVGFANYRRLTARHRNTDIGIGIGEPALWGQGLGAEALDLLVRHLLQDHGLHRIRLHVAATNHRAIAAYRRAGFEVEGREKDAVSDGAGGWSDMLVMGLVAGHARPAFDPSPITLRGRHVVLEPLRLEHAAELWPAIDDDDAWTHAGWRPRSVADTERYMREALDRQVAGEHLPWLTRRCSDGQVIGTTRYGAIDRPNRSVEIGWTVVAPRARRTAANTEAKYLQLSHAFDTLGALRVWLKADVRNERSRRAIERIGATLEGIIRSERVMPDGRVRDAAYHSIVAADWPAVKTRLERLLDR